MAQAAGQGVGGIWLALAFALAATGAAVAPARAESPELPDANYRNLRYDDDEAALRRLGGGADIFDPFKAMRLGDGSSTLSIGGEIRERDESYLNQNFGFKAPPNDNYDLQRLQLDFDLRVASYFRAFLQFSDDDRHGQRGVTSTTDIDRGDFTQAFVDFRPPTPFGDAPDLRLGREELLFGYQRLIAVREGPNARRSFDGVRASDVLGGFTIDAFAVHPVNDSPGVLDDAPNLKQTLTGVYATTPLFGDLKADLYALSYTNTAGKYRNLTGTDQRATSGARLFGKAAGFDVNLEGSWQEGSFAGHPVRAWLLAAIAGYTFGDVRFQPRLGVSANFASGDDAHSATIGTFNAMYPRLPYFAETSQLVPANLKDVRPTLAFEPVKGVQTVLGWDRLWRASTSDGLYGSGETLYAGTNAPRVTASAVGN